jgi:FKBP-type peptidyl-prolyl cis-trans isomerase
MTVDRTNHLLSVAILSLLWLGCTAPESTQRPPAAEPPPPAEEAPRPKAATTVFDPNNPPPGWVLCHRNHCHNQDGRVASYAQVMQEVGATTMVGGNAPAAAPAAPPDVAAVPADATRTPSGLASRMLKEGTVNRRPSATSIVTVHYTGWTTNGQAFDSSVARGQPAQFPLNRVIPGWTEGLQLMAQGEERRFWIPEALAYKGQPGKPQGTLVFDVELISIRD